MRWNLPGSRYDEIRSTVADVLEDRGITEYPFSLFAFVRNLGIRIVPYGLLPMDLQIELRAKNVDGFTKRPTNFNPLGTVIFYDDELPYERIRFTLAHELGHIFLEHPDTGEEKYEHEADIFANYFLAPAPIVARDSQNNVEQIMDDFFISYSCALSVRDRTAKRARFGRELLEYEERILECCRLVRGGEKIA